MNKQNNKKNLLRELITPAAATPLNAEKKELKALSTSFLKGSAFLLGGDIRSNKEIGGYELILSC